MTILSHPGPVPPVNAEVMATQRQIIAREYRNCRIGDFLKELHLTEARGTGFPTIYNAMADNGSPEPAFETDEATYVMVTIPIHDSFKDTVSDRVSDQVNELIINTIDDVIALCKQVSDQVSDVVEKDVGRHVIAILSMLLDKSLSSADILSDIGLTKHTTNKQKHIDPLIDIAWIKYTIPDKPKDRNQKYKITFSSKKLLKILNKS